MNYNALIDARCPGGAAWSVQDESGTIVACLVSEALARQYAAGLMSGVAIAAGLGVPQDLPTPTPTTGQAYRAPNQGGSTGGGAQPGAVLRPDLATGIDGPNQPTRFGMGGGYRDHGRSLGQTDEIETRNALSSWPALGLELRSDGDGMHFTGYAAVFDTDSIPRPYVETIAPGAFSRSLGQDKDIRMYLNHDLGKLLATRKAGTLRLSEDSRGLLVDADLPDTTDGRNTAELIRRGDIAEMSFTFKKQHDSWTDGGQRRRLQEVKLFEVSPMTEWAGYDATSVSVRSLGDLARAAVRRVREGRGFSDSAYNAATGAGILQSLLYLLSTESDEPDQMAMIQSSIDSLQRWMTAEQAEVGTVLDQNALRPHSLKNARARLELLARA